MASTKVLVLGAGKAARYVAYIYGYSPDIEVFGFTDNNPLNWQTFLAGKKVLGSDEVGLAEAYLQGVRHVNVALGAPSLRARLRLLAQSAGFELISAVHPSAIVSPSVKLGKGAVVEAGSVLSDNPVLHENVWIGLASMVSHDTIVGSDCSIGGRAAVGAEVSIGEQTQIGMGAIVQSGKKIGAHTLVGSGSNVISDIPDHVVVVGNPARIIKNRND